MALHGIWSDFILYLNIFLLWMAFMLYLLVNSMVYSRLKFFPLPAPEVAPSFVIWLAPIGVSVIAINTYYLALMKNNIFNWNLDFVHSFVQILSAMIYGYGFWWFALTLLIISYYLIKKSLPYSLGWWAFVFPVAAFGIGLKFLAIDLGCNWICPVVSVVWLIAVVLWIVVLYKTLVWIVTKKAFIRPKVVK